MYGTVYVSPVGDELLWLEIVGSSLGESFLVGHSGVKRPIHGQEQMYWHWEIV